MVDGAVNGTAIVPAEDAVDNEDVDVDEEEGVEEEDDDDDDDNDDDGKHFIGTRQFLPMPSFFLEMKYKGALLRRRPSSDTMVV